LNLQNSYMAGIEAFCGSSPKGFITIVTSTKLELRA